MPTVLRLEAITKRFGSFLANDGITIELKRGEIVALLGENGAGKTTLMNILFGHYVADEGRVLVDGEPLPPGRPGAAIAAGVGMVHQHFALAANLTVLENVTAGTERLTSLWRRRKAARAKLTSLAARFGLAVDPDARVGDLSVGERQRVEILKALYNDARILILDEPTAVLTTPEAETLFATLRTMAREGLSLIFISHKLGEVMSAADRIVVLRRGQIVAERTPAATTREELAELMVGRRVARPRRTEAHVGEVVLHAAGVDVVDGGRKRLGEISFEVRSGETLAIVGVSGNGQSALGALVSGLLRPARGTLAVLGEPVADPRTLVGRGVGRIPEDRHAEGAVGELTVWENVILERVRDPDYAARGIIRRGTAKAHAAEVVAKFDVRGGGAGRRAALLSGGNLQKLILGRNLVAGPRLLIAAQPTRGLDEGAIAEVHRAILEARDAGAGVLLISEDLDEVLGLADRVQAIVGGRLSPPEAADALDSRRLGLMMAGEWRDAA